MTFAPQLLSNLQSAASVVEPTGLTTYNFARLEQFDDPRMMWGIVAAAAIFFVGLVAWQYRREGGSIGAPTSILLTLLRLTAVAGALLFYLGPQKRTDQEVVEESRAVLLVDVSQSMAVEDVVRSDSAAQTRMNAVASVLQESSLLKDLQAEHEVSVIAFDSSTNRLAQWPRKSQSGESSNEVEIDGTTERSAEPTLPPWTEQLQPLGEETRLGDALASVMSESSGGPLAGVIVITDGRQTGGLDAVDAIKLTGQREIMLAAIGVGSTEPRRNVRVQELVVPKRAYPEDKVTAKAVVSSEGMQGKSVEVELYARELAGDAQSAATLISRKTANFDSDPQVVTIDFQLEPSAVGRLELEAKVRGVQDDQFSADNQRREEMEIVETNSRVLLLASAATRDFRFLRNQLRRDRHATVDVLLQSSPQGISQDADAILGAFPSTGEKLFEYDCIVAFDADWSELDAQQADLLEQWVAEEAGGLIVVAGPIHTSALAQSAEHAKIRALYPVAFQRRLTLLDDGVFGSTSPWPLDFTREGREAEFLRLSDLAEDSEEVWSDFSGVYGCFAVKGAKPGAQVVARYTDPDAGISVERPVYWAEHFYGAGRVFYMGSGELWRLRMVDPKYFERIYTQLIRHVSQGRLLRGSSAGYLLVERDRYVTGDTVAIRAQLKSANREPLVAPRVTARVRGPDGKGRNIDLVANETAPGLFFGQFTARQQGSYSIVVSPPDLIDQQLVRRIEVSPPDVEFRQTSQDAAQLAELARTSGGIYYKNLSAAVNGGDGLQPVASLMKSRAEIRVQQGSPDQQFADNVRRLLLLVICGALCSEWILRRLVRLA